jgi:hypothetical protein
MSAEMSIGGKSAVVNHIISPKPGRLPVFSITVGNDFSEGTVTIYCEENTKVSPLYILALVVPKNIQRRLLISVLGELFNQVVNVQTFPTIDDKSVKINIEKNHISKCNEESLMLSYVGFCKSDSVIVCQICNSHNLCRENCFSCGFNLLLIDTSSNNSVRPSNTDNKSSSNNASSSIFNGGGISSSSLRAPSLTITGGGGAKSQKNSFKNDTSSTSIGGSLLNLFGLDSTNNNIKSNNRYSKGLRPDFFNGGIHNNSAPTPVCRNAIVLSNDVTVFVTYPEHDFTIEVKFLKRSNCSNIMNIMGALASNVKTDEQGYKAFVKCSNGFHNELLLEQPYYNTMHEYYLRTTRDNEDFPLSITQLLDFFPSTPLERGKNQVNPLLKDLYKTIHQLKNGDELIFFSSQTPTLQPAMTIDAVKGSVRFNQPMLKALDELTDDYSGYRNIRGDGNCYYRAFMIGFIEDLIRQRNIQGLIHLLRMMREVMISKELGRIKPQRYYQEKEFLNYLKKFNIKLNNTIDYFSNTLINSNKPNLWKTEKDFELDVMRNPALDIVLVWSSRLMVSEYLVKNKNRNMNNFGMSIDQMFTTCFEEKGIKSTEDYCEADILTWGVDAESPFIELGVLEEILHCKCNIIILDRNGNCKAVSYEFQDEKPVFGSVSLFLKPGHYDLLVPVGNMQVQQAPSNNDSSSSASSSVENTGWSCKLCTFDNTNCSTMCDMCRNPK